MNIKDKDTANILKKITIKEEDKDTTNMPPTQLPHFPMFNQDSLHLPQVCLMYTSPHSYLTISYLICRVVTL